METLTKSEKKNNKFIYKVSHTFRILYNMRNIFTPKNIGFVLEVLLFLSSGFFLGIGQTSISIICFLFAILFALETGELIKNEVENGRKNV